ncbi:MAG: aldo/keto reductase [Rhizobiaceae bacterium]|nr:aldo/keto reductase [Rhizobiaceae bacterium]MCV0406552.1 aldo/keto reductase [Rhizobiaceae bacterium]
MRQVRLGRTGLHVSRLCLGCMSFGPPGGPTHPWVIDEDAAQPFFRRAIEAGITFFDTANHYNYGASEEITGRALKKYARRDEIVLATKVGLKMGEGPNQRGLSRGHILDQVDRSLKRLGMDHIDLYYVHRLDPHTPFEETLTALDDLVRAGKVRYLGASSMWAWQFVMLRETQRANGLAEFVAMQNFYNLAYREEEREMMPYCAAEGVGVVPWSPIARGFLAGNRPKEGEASNRAKTDKQAHAYFGSRADYAVLAAVEKAAKRLGVSPAQAAYAWVLSKDFVTSPIVGATKLSQLDEAIAAEALDLDARTIRALEAPYRPRAVMGHQ